MIQKISKKGKDFLYTVRRVSTVYKGQRRPTITVAYVCDPAADGARYAVGISVCSPSDNPQKARGDSIAINRGISALDFRSSVRATKIVTALSMDEGTIDELLRAKYAR